MEKKDEKKENREIRYKNRMRIARIIAEAGAISKNEIGAGLGLSMPTVLQCVKELKEDGIIMESGEYGSTGGRKAKVLSIAGDAAFAAGMDITKSHIAFVLVNLNKELVKKARIRLPFSKEYSYYEGMGDWLRVFLEQSGEGKEKILGVGISLPGIVDQGEKLLVSSQALGVENMSFKQFERIAGYPCQVESDVNGAAYAEFYGEGRDGVYLALDDTVEGAVFMDGALYGGDSRKGARFGHMKLERDGRRCRCGGRGCVDAYCSSRALLGEDPGLEVFFKKAEAGEQGYKARLDEYLEYVAAASVNLRMAFGCDVVLGGKAGKYLKGFRRELDRKVEKYDRLDLDLSFLRIGKCQPEMSAYGAALKLVDGFFGEGL